MLSACEIPARRLARGRLLVGGRYAEWLTSRHSQRSLRERQPPRTPQPCRRSRTAPAWLRARRPHTVLPSPPRLALVPPRLGPDRVLPAPARPRSGPGQPPLGPPPCKP